jgi:peroxiredoxin
LTNFKQRTMKTSAYKIVLPLVILLVVFAFKPKTDDAGYSVGDYASDFKLRNVDGNYVSLADYKDARGFLVIFTCNTCPYAMAYEDRIKGLDQKYKASGVPVIAINPNNPGAQPGDSFEKMKQRANAKAYSFPYLQDEGQKVYPMYGATRTPHVFLLEKTGKGYLVRYIGTIDDNYQDADAVEARYVEDAVDAMLSGGQIEIKTTRAIGCSIKT